MTGKLKALTAQAAERRLRQKADPDKAKIARSFFKTGPGEYAEGDIFCGVTVPEVRKIAHEFRDLRRSEIDQLLTSKWHESRMLALLILVAQFKPADPQEQKSIYDFYLARAHQINNWDLVDLSADKIVGAYLFHCDTQILFTLVQDSNLWKRRIAIVATYYFIRNHQFGVTLKLAEQLLHDPHDLIHKAVGWMLREVGKRDAVSLERFLGKHAATMPRTMLRYAIEKFPDTKRQHYLKLKSLKSIKAQS